MPNAFFFTLALRRLNDWVPQVRNAARETLPKVVLESDPQHVADALWYLLDHWNSWGRMEPTERDVVIGLISTDAAALALSFKILRATAGPAAHVLSQCARSATFDQWIGDYARNALAPAVRAKATRWLLEGRVSWAVGRTWKWTDLKWGTGRFESVFEHRTISAREPFIDILKTAMMDRSVMVRRVAAEFLMQEMRLLGDNASDLARRLSSDANPSIAERGRFALKMIDTSH